VIAFAMIPSRRECNSLSVLVFMSCETIFIAGTRAAGLLASGKEPRISLVPSRKSLVNGFGGGEFSEMEARSSMVWVCAGAEKDVNLRAR